MENASRALIMAAGVLIGILILSLGAYLVIDLGSRSASISKEIESQRIVESNSKYTSYASTSDDRKLLTVYDIITILGYAKENNNYYEIENLNDENAVIVKINGDEIMQYTTESLLSKYGQR